MNVLYVFEVFLQMSLVGMCVCFVGKVVIVIGVMQGFGVDIVCVFVNEGVGVLIVGFDDVVGYVLVVLIGILVCFVYIDVIDDV